MPRYSESPYIAHVFVCTNDRGRRKKACADNGGPMIKSRLKEMAYERGWKGRVRISTSGCMGLCEQGPNVMIYPRKIWFRKVSADQLKEIMSVLEGIMEGD